MQLVLGTHNRKKRAEIERLLHDLPVQVKTLQDFEDPLDVIEDGDSFAANAARKAQQQAVHLQQWVMGEDSGLCVDALDGAPGIYTARFAGPDASDAENNALLLQKMSDVPLKKRNAHYVSHITLADPQGTIHVDCEAICRGRIRFEPAGHGGFGYDPVFELIEYHRTFAELGDAVKAILSHRSRALRQFIPQLLVLCQT